jgi:hypothetical protein
MTCYTVWTLNYPSIIRPDLPLCQKASTGSSLHPSGCLSSTSRGRSVVDQQWDFFLKHRYVKTTATVQTMRIPVRTRSFIRQVMHSKFNHPNNIIHCPDAQASYMEIPCIRPIVRTIAIMVWTHQALI